ncbi:hypothetical protein DFQ27_001599, partial [Actinomortierella ambigua]
MVDRSPPHPYSSSSSSTAPSGRMASLSVNTSVRQHQQQPPPPQQQQQQQQQQKPSQTASISSSTASSGRYYSNSYSQHHLSAHHPHLSHHHHHHHQHHPDIHGPLSAGVVENMSHRSFASYPYSRESSAHSSHYPLFHAPAPPPPAAAPAASSTSSSSRTADNNAAGTSALPPSQPYQQLSVSDILERYRDANPDLLMTVLNAKSKEDEELELSEQQAAI